MSLDASEVPCLSKSQIQTYNLVPSLAPSKGKALKSRLWKKTEIGANPYKEANVLSGIQTNVYS